MGLGLSHRRFGTGSSGLRTVDFEANNLLKILLWSNGSWTVTSFSTNGGIFENLLFFINLNKILNFFLAESEGFLKVLFTVS